MATHDREKLTADILQPAIDFALTLIPMAQWESKDIATDAAVDAVLWCLTKLEEGEQVTDWPAFVMAQVKKTVRRDMHQHRERRQTVRDEIGKRNSKLDICERGGRSEIGRPSPDGKLPLDLLDSLTTEQAEAVRLFFVDGETTRSGAAIVGVDEKTFRNRLNEAASAIGGSQIATDGPTKKLKRFDARRKPKKFRRIARSS